MKNPVEVSVDLVWDNQAKQAKLTGTSVEIQGALYPRELRALAQLSAAIRDVIDVLKQPHEDAGSR